MHAEHAAICSTEGFRFIDTSGMDKQNRFPYELRTCNNCDGRSVQDKQHVLLNCLSPDLIDLPHKHQHLFKIPRDGPVRDFIHQPDTKGLCYSE